jgi:hypothetical protein
MTPREQVEKEIAEELGSDLCNCGDYRSQHGDNGCKVCRNSRAPYDGCVKFRLHRAANEAEQAHWDKWNLRGNALVASRLKEKEKHGT